MNKLKFTVLTVIFTAVTAVSYIFNIPEMVDSQRAAAAAAVSAVFILASIAYVFLCRKRKVVLIAGLVYWGLSLVASALIAGTILSGSDASVFLIPAFAFSGGYFSLAALLGAPGKGYLAVLIIIPVIELIYHTVLLETAKRSRH